jgi:protein gp37
MAGKTIYEYATKSWPIVKGCSPDMPCAKRCWAKRECHRLAGNPNQKIATFHQGLTDTDGNWTGVVKLNEAHLGDPLGWKDPERIAVAYHGDLFRARWSQIERVFEVMQQCPQHLFLLLTKLPNHAFLFADNWAFHHSGALSNVLFGVSIMQQSDADEHRDSMMWLAGDWRTWVSYEPAIGPVDWKGWEFLKFMAVGGESGPCARPCDIAWIRSVVEQCKASGVPCFVKQLGSHATATIPNSHGDLTFRFTGAGSKPWGKGADPTEWPEDLRVRELPEVAQ